MKAQIFTLVVAALTALQPAQALMHYKCENAKTNDQLLIKQGPHLYDVILNGEDQFSGIDFVSTKGPFFIKDKMDLFTTKGVGPVGELVINKTKLFNDNCGRGFCENFKKPVISRGGLIIDPVVDEAKSVISASLTTDEITYVFQKCTSL